MEMIQSKQVVNFTKKKYLIYHEPPPSSRSIRTVQRSRWIRPNLPPGQLISLSSKKKIGTHYILNQVMVRGTYGVVYRCSLNSMQYARKTSENEEKYSHQNLAVKIVPSGKSDHMEQVYRDIEYEYRHGTQMKALWYTDTWIENVSDLPNIVADGLAHMTNLTNVEKCLCMAMVLCPANFLDQSKIDSEPIPGHECRPHSGPDQSYLVAELIEMLRTAQFFLGKRMKCGPMKEDEYMFVWELYENCAISGTDVCDDGKIEDLGEGEISASEQDSHNAVVSTQDTVSSIQALLLKMISKNPLDRPQLSDVIETLEGLPNMSLRSSLPYSTIVEKAINGSFNLQWIKYKRVTSNLPRGQLTPLEEGDKIGKKYLIESLIDRGSYGCVFLSTVERYFPYINISNDDRERIAIKMIPMLESNSDHIKQINREIEFQYRYESRVRISWYSEIWIEKFSNLPETVIKELECLGNLTDINRCLCMASALSSANLSQILEQRNTQHSIFPEEMFRREFLVTEFIEIVRTVQWLHENGIIHRDLKLKNLLWFQDFDINKRKRCPILKVSDFGLARYIDDDIGADKSSGPVGRSVDDLSPFCGGYIYAPEILSGDYSYKVDTYALGIILIQILCPIDGTEYHNLIKDIIKFEQIPSYVTQNLPPFILDLMVKMISDSPQDRPELVRVIEILEKLPDRIMEPFNFHFIFGEEF